MTDKPKTTIITPVGFLSYPHFVTPKAVNPGDTPMFSGTIVWPAGTDLTVVREALLAAGIKKFGAAAPAQLKSGRLDSILREDPEQVKEKRYPEGSVYLNSRSKTRPGLVFLQADPATGKPALVPEGKIAEVFYPGAKVRFQLSFYGYDKGMKKGVSASLANVQVVEYNTPDTPRWDGRDAATDAFESQGTLAADMADLENEESY